MGGSIFSVPKEARWAHLKSKTPQPTIRKLVDDAMTAIERDNPSLKGVLPKDFGRPGLDKQRLGHIINLVSDIAFGNTADRATDTLGTASSARYLRRVLIAIRCVTAAGLLYLCLGSQSSKGA